MPSQSSQHAADSLKGVLVEDPIPRVTVRRRWAIVLRRFTVLGFLAVLYATFLSSYISKESLISTASSHYPDLYEASIAELQAGLESGLFTSVDLVKVRAFDSSVKSAC